MKKRAFTFLELILVLAIMAVIMCMAVLKMPSLSAFEEKQELYSVIRMIKDAKNYAILNRKATTVDFSNGDKAVLKVRNDVIEEKDLELIKLISGAQKVGYAETGFPSTPTSLEFEGKNKIYIVTIAVASGKVGLKDEIEIKDK